MIGRKRWLNKICNDFEEKNNPSQQNISWSSSGSEDESFGYKKLKLIKNSCRNGEYSAETSVDVAPSESPVFTSSPLRISQILLKNENSPSPSPISLSAGCSNEKSPVLNKNYNVSPVLIKKFINPPRAPSPDMFESQKIEQETSPEKFEISISIVTSEENLKPTLNIDEFSSQERSSSPRVNDVINSGSSNNKSENSSNGSSHLYHFPRVRKKRYKKDGLRAFLHKILVAQRTRLNIWQHEIDKNLICFKDFEEEIVYFEILLIKREYGNTVLKCNKIKNGNEQDIIYIFVSSFVNINFDVNNKYTLFPPYEIKLMTIELRKALCYLNSTRFVADK